MMEQLIKELEQWCAERGVTLECAAANAKGETIPVAFFLPVGVEPVIQIVVKENDTHTEIAN